MQVPLFAGGVVHWRCRALVALQPLMVPAPATPPVLNELITAHRVFVERKRAERERAETEWRLQVAAQIDAERLAAAAHDSRHTPPAPGGTGARRHLGSTRTGAAHKGTAVSRAGFM